MSTGFSESPLGGVGNTLLIFRKKQECLSNTSGRFLRLRGFVKLLQASESLPVLLDMSMVRFPNTYCNRIFKNKKFQTDKHLHYLATGEHSLPLESPAAWSVQGHPLEQHCLAWNWNRSQNSDQFVYGFYAVAQLGSSQWQFCLSSVADCIMFLQTVLWGSWCRHKQQYCSGSNRKKGFARPYPYLISYCKNDINSP